MLIGVYGWSRSGKDTIANYLVEHHGFTRFAFADPLRSVLLEIFEVATPLTADHIKSVGWDAMKADAPWIVDAMIALGAGMRNHVDPDVWVRALNYQEGQNIVVSDMRHLNELHRVLDFGGELWKVTREGTSPRAMDSLLSDWREWDAQLQNNGSLDDLYKLIDHGIEWSKG